MRMGALTGALAVLPSVSEVLPGKAGDYAFPPLGTYQLFWESVSVVISAVIILLVFFIRNSSYVVHHDKRLRAFIVLGGIAFLALIAYFVAVHVTVRTLWIPTEKKEITVSVGFRRTAFAEREFAGEGDWTMLEKMGWNEEQIRKLWMCKSILIARSFMILTAMGQSR